jgi:hypothetical protein
MLENQLVIIVASELKINILYNNLYTSYKHM